VGFIFHKGNSMSTQTKKVKIKADVFWCQHTKVNDMSGKYQLNLCNLSDAAADALESMGISVQVGEDKKADMGRYITCKSQSPIRVHDADGDEITEAIGNGSKAKALIGSYEWTYKNKKGVSPSLGKLVITELVEYGADSALDGDDSDVL
jgi:hypothetical protein